MCKFVELDDHWYTGSIRQIAARGTHLGHSEPAKLFGRLYEGGLVVT